MPGLFMFVYRRAEWWDLPQIEPPTGPFFYAFNSSLDVAKPQVYLSFSFPGVQGWVQQTFFSVRPLPPPASRSPCGRCRLAADLPSPSATPPPANAPPLQTCVVCLLDSAKNLHCLFSVFIFIVKFVPVLSAK